MEEADPNHTSNPPPTFADLALSDELNRAIEDLGYTHPTPVQREVFDPAKRGLDLVVQARTGTGKTAAFGMPIVDAIVRRGQEHVQALILCPTRELALQVSRELEALGKYRGIKPVAIYGGAPMPRQVEQIRAGAQVLVGTPGRVLDHLQRGTLDVSQLRLFVLDESDEMLSMGFLPQIDQIQRYLPEARQTLLFSATLPPDIQRLAETRLRNPEFLTLSGDHIGALEITHLVYLSRGDKLAELIQVLEVEDPESAIIFCNTRDETKRVAAALQQQGFTADWMNADLAQGDREKVMAATRQGELRFLVCTDVAARGIDISHLTHVINFDFPEASENYVHRTGRTGRAGRTGTAVSLIEPKDIGNLYLTRLTYKIRTVERQLPTAREIRTRAEADLVEMFVQAFADRVIHGEDSALAKRLLTHEMAEQVVAGLLRDHLGARPEAQEEATAARHSKRPREADGHSPEPREASPTRNDRPSRGVESRDRRRPKRDEARDLRRPMGDEARGPRRPMGVRTDTEGSRPRTATEPADPDKAKPVAAVAPEQVPPSTLDLARPTPSADPGAEEVPSRGGSPRRRRPSKTADTTGARAFSPHEQLSPAAYVEEFEFGYTVSDFDPQALRDAEADTITKEIAPSDDGTEAVTGLVELYVNVGKKDGASEADFESLLAAKAGILRHDTGYIRVRNRHTFVAVREEIFERAQRALDGAEIAGKCAVAEPARPRL